MSLRDSVCDHHKREKDLTICDKPPYVLLVACYVGIEPLHHTGGREGGGGGGGGGGEGGREGGEGGREGGEGGRERFTVAMQGHLYRCTMVKNH